MQAHVCENKTGKGAEEGNIRSSLINHWILANKAVEESHTCQTRAIQKDHGYDIPWAIEGFLNA